MGTNTSNFLVGMGIGTALGVIAYRFSRTRQGRHLRHKVNCTMHDIGDKAGEWYETAKDKVKDMGSKVAEKGQEAADKAEEFLNRSHSFATKS